MVISKLEYGYSLVVIVLRFFFESLMISTLNLDWTDRSIE